MKYYYQYKITMRPKLNLIEITEASTTIYKTKKRAQEEGQKTKKSINKKLWYVDGVKIIKLKVEDV